MYYTRTTMAYATEGVEDFSVVFLVVRGASLEAVRGMLSKPEQSVSATKRRWWSEFASTLDIGLNSRYSSCSHLNTLLLSAGEKGDKGEVGPEGVGIEGPSGPRGFPGKFPAPFIDGMDYRVACFLISDSLIA